MVCVRAPATAPPPGHAAPRRVPSSFVRFHAPVRFRSPAPLLSQFGGPAGAHFGEARLSARPSTPIHSLGLFPLPRVMFPSSRGRACRSAAERIRARRAGARIRRRRREFPAGAVDPRATPRDRRLSPPFSRGAARCRGAPPGRLILAAGKNLNKSAEHKNILNKSAEHKNILNESAEHKNILN